MCSSHQSQRFTVPRSSTNGYSYVSYPSGPQEGISILGRRTPVARGYSDSRPFSYSSRRCSSFPPPASVEDEADSLAREHGAPLPDSVSDCEPPSKGDRDQSPVIMEVHEYNPERRFVMVNDGSKTPTTNVPLKQATTKPPKSSDTEAERLPDISGDHKNQTSSRSSERERAEGVKPSLDRRSSKQNLPPLQTGESRRPQSGHHRSRSTAAVDAVNPSYFAPRTSRPAADQLLSPEIAHSAHWSRDNSDREWNRSTLENRSPNRQSPYDMSNQGRDNLHHRRTRTSSMSQPISSTFEDPRASKRLSGEWSKERESLRRRDCSPPPRSADKENVRTSRRRQGDGGVTPPRTPRGQSISSNASQGRHAHEAPRKSTANVQDGYYPSTERGQRARSPMRTMPATPPDQAASTTQTSRASTTLPPGANEQRQSRSTKVPLPYPDDDDPRYLDIRAKDRDRSTTGAPRPPPIVTMPEPAQISTTSGGKTADRRHPSPPVASPRKTPDAWQLPPFDPGKTRIGLDRPVGSYRRYSETKNQSGPGGLPECPRIKAVVGKTDWLTLPRTNFNICPTCYDSVFAQSEFRTHFQPILRPTDEAIVCDFGSSPWYRIAWLFTLKHDQQDLRLIHHVIDVVSSLRGEVCPGDRRATRDWMSIKDPYTRRPVPEFAVCYPCALKVEAVLPNLTGIFVALSSRTEPTREICALHFAPNRTEFVNYFDAFEMTSEKALTGSQVPDIQYLAKELHRLSVGLECREDSPVRDGFWHQMQSIPELTVCNACFIEVVQPRVHDGNIVAQSFFTKAQRLPVATCQLYSPRMRDVFNKACRRRDQEYLQARVLERREIEADIYDKLLKLDRQAKKDSRSEKQVERLVEEWKRWE